MHITMRKLRSLIKESIDELHRTIAGNYVPFGCAKCIKDIEYRIEDACNFRDQLSHRSDAREHYNGILKVLRRELRRARRVNGL